MRLNRAIKRLRITECQFFSFMPPIASAKVARINTAASCSLAAHGASTVLQPGAACVKLQVDCLGVGVKIELDHGPINAPLSALGQKQTCALHQPMSALPPKADRDSSQRRGAMAV